MSTRHIALCCDANYLMPAAVTIQSVIDSAKRPIALHFWLLTPGLPPQKSAPIERMALARGAQLTVVDCSSAHARMQAAHTERYLSTAAYYRLFLPELLPATIQRVLYLDCDLLIRADVDPLFDTDLAGHAVAAVLNPLARYKPLGLARAEDYFNSGLLILDLARLRRTGEHLQALEFAQNNPDKIPTLDQDALNHVLSGRWARLDLRWNQQFKFFRYDHRRLGLTKPALDRIRKAPFAVHFTSKSKPWHYDNCHPFQRHWFTTLDRTPFAGWRPSPKNVRDRARRACLRLLPFPLHPDHLRNEYRPRYHAFRARWSRLLAPAAARHG